MKTCNMELKNVWNRINDRLDIAEKISELEGKAIKMLQGFPGGTVVENPPANAVDTGSIPGPGRSHMPWSN